MKQTKTFRLTLTRGLILSAFLAGLALSGQAALDTGAGRIQLEIRADAAYDSSIYANSNEVDDTVVTFAPMVRYVQDRGIHHFEIGAGAEIARYTDYGDEDYEDGILEFQLSGPHRESNTDYALSGGWRQQTQSVEEIGTIASADIAELDGRFGFTFSDKTGLRLGAGYENKDWSDALYADSETLYGRAELLWIYSEKLDLFAGYRYKDIDYDSRYTDWQTDTFFIGGEGQFSEKLSGTAEIGYGLSDGELDDYIYWSLGLDWASSEKTTWSLTGTRDGRPSVTGQNALTSELRITLYQRITDKLRVSGYYFIGTFEREGAAARDDDIMGAGASLNWDLDEAVSLYARLSSTGHSSNSPIADYTRDIVAVGATLLF